MPLHQFAYECYHWPSFYLYAIAFVRTFHLSWISIWVAFDALMFTLAICFDLNIFWMVCLCILSINTNNMFILAHDNENTDKTYVITHSNHVRHSHAFNQSIQPALVVEIGKDLEPQNWKKKNYDCPNIDKKSFTNVQKMIGWNPFNNWTVFLWAFIRLDIQFWFLSWRCSIYLDFFPLYRIV